MANIITIFRVICSLVLLVVKTFSPCFYTLYILCGISDMIDGFVARRTHTESDIGSKLDSIADLTFVIVSIVKVIPVINISGWLLTCIILIILIRAINVILGFVYYKKLIMLHTISNKITGFMLFIFPLTFNLIDIKYSAVPLVCIAFLSAVQEGHFIRLGKI